ncbi:MAG: hypothetical protein KC442_13370 [Thermomicrobiales bacterium]|nr:hypothetical protein [Thermomicrobiales bacterium]
MFNNVNLALAILPVPLATNGCATRRADMLAPTAPLHSTAVKGGGVVGGVGAAWHLPPTHACPGWQHRFLPHFVFGALHVFLCFFFRLPAAASREAIAPAANAAPSKVRRLRARPLAMVANGWLVMADLRFWHVYSAVG